MARHPQPHRSIWFPVAVSGVVALGIATVGWLDYRHQRSVARTRAADELAAVAALKITQLVTWRRERVADISALSRNRLVAVSLQPFLTDPAAVDADGAIRVWLESLRKSFDYRDVVLIDAHGAVRLTVGDEDREVGPYAANLVAEALRTGQPSLSDFRRPTSTGNVELDLCAPLPGPQAGAGDSIGVLLFRVSPQRFLYPLIQTWPTPSPTAETLIIRREGGSVVFLNELRHLRNTALNLRLPVGFVRLPAAMAVRGHEGLVEGEDYRGVKVLASVRRVPDSPWFLVAKVDAAELYAPLRAQAASIAAVVASLVLAVGLAGAAWWKHESARLYRRQYEAERERLALVRHFEYLTRYANDIIILADADQRIVEANDRACTAYGYRRDEFLGQSMDAVRPPQGKAEAQTMAQRAEQQDGLLFETVHQRRDGTLFPVEVSLRVVAAEGATYYQGIIRDITERKQSEAALQESEVRFRELSENMSSGVAIYAVEDNGRRFVIRGFNRAAERIENVSREQVIGRNVEEAFPGAREFGIVDALERVWRTGQPERLPVSLYRDQRLASWRENYIYKLPSGEVVATYDDLTLRKQAEDEIQTLNAELEQRVAQRTTELAAANRELEAFAYSVSHDLRAPLRSIDGFSLAVLEDCGDQLDDTARDHLAHVRLASQRMGLLIDDLLRLSRVSRAEMHREPVDLSALALRVVADLRREAPGRRAEFVIPPNLVATADPALMQIALENLLGNAWKFTGKHATARIEFGVVTPNAAEAAAKGPEPGPEDGNRGGEKSATPGPRATGKFTKPAPPPVYFVRDDGAGFDMAYADKLFGAFQRLHGLDEFPGTGIGLATVQRIVHRSGGRVWAEAAVEQGATFYFTLGA